MQELRVKIAGLYSYPSDLSAVPPGALTQAQNIVLDQDSVAAPRRGFDYLAYTVNGSAVQAQFPQPTERANKYFFYQNNALCQYDKDQLAWFDPAAGWTAFSGSYTPVCSTATGTTVSGSAVITSLSAVSGVAYGGAGLVVGQVVYGTGVPRGAYVVSFTSTTVTLSQVATASASGVALTFVVAKSRYAQAAQNLFLTANAGIQKLSAYNSTPALAGVPAALDVQVAAAAASTTVTASINWATSATVLHVTSTAGLGIGMVSGGSGNIPTSALITALTATTITISVAATGSGSSASFSAPITPITSTGTTFNSVNYRVLWNIVDAHNNLVTGAPSQPVLAQNLTGVNCAFNVTFTVPAGITTSHFYQVYRSPQATTAGSAVLPNDNEYLVYQGYPVSADISAGTITVCDITPDGLVGAEIYTAQDQEGSALANLPLPQAQDIAVFRDCMFYANTQSLPSATVSLLGVGGNYGLQAADTITIGGVVYTASASTETPSTGTFQLITPVGVTRQGDTTTSSKTITNLSTRTSLVAGQSITGTGIPANTFITAVTVSTLTLSNAATASNSNIDLVVTGQTNGDPNGSTSQSIVDTCLSLVRVINRDPSSVVTAAYASGPGSTPGQILLTAKTFGVGFTPTVSRATAWGPLMPSNSSIAKNGLWYSKQSQHEAVPVAYFMPVGSASANILRIIALRDSLVVLKEDGTFIVQGFDPTSFVLRPLDYTSILVAAESAVLLNNQIFCLTTQGVVAVSEIGTPIVSHPIEGTLLSLLALNLPLLQNASFGVAYESDRSYYLFLPTYSTDVSATQYFRWNYLTSTWTSGLLNKTCGQVNPASNQLWLGDATLNITSVERKNYAYSDYADYVSTQTIQAISVDGLTLTVSEVDTFVVGDVVWQSQTAWGIVTAVNTFAGTVTLAIATPLVTGSADILAGIPVVIEWAPVTFDNPGFTKQLWEGVLLFLDGFQGPGTVGFTTDLSGGEGTESLTGGAIGPWGLFAWGGPQDIISGNTLNTQGAFWGGDPTRGTVRFSVGRNWQRCSQFSPSFSHSYAYSPWKLQGISLIGNVVSERTKN